MTPEQKRAAQPLISHCGCVRTQRAVWHLMRCTHQHRLRSSSRSTLRAPADARGKASLLGRYAVIRRRLSLLTYRQRVASPWPAFDLWAARSGLIRL